MTDLYRINSADIMHETIDGEVVIINLDHGLYYSLEGTGAWIWERLSEARSLDGLAAISAEHFEGDPGQMRASIESFLTRLGEEALICPAGPEEATAPAAPAGAKMPWADPGLQKYTDMEQLLLLDPIHEVEDTGWPNVN